MQRARLTPQLETLLLCVQGAPAGQQEQPSEASPAGHDAFADFGTSPQPPQQQASSWGQPVLRPNWSTQPNATQSINDRNADANFDDDAALPSAPQLDAPEGAAFDLADLHGALPASGYEADPPQQFLPQASGGGSGGFNSGPVEPKKGEDHLPALFPMEAPPAPAQAPQPQQQAQQEEARPAYVPQSYSQFSQPQVAARDGGGQGSRPGSSASAAQQPSQAAHQLPEQLSQTPPQAASASSQAHGGQSAAQAGAGGQRGMLQASQAYDVPYGGDLRGSDAPAFLSQAPKGGDYPGVQQASQQSAQASAPQQQAAPPQHMQQPSPGAQAPQQHGMPQGELAHHGSKGDVSHLEGGLDKGDAGQQHMHGQFGGQLPDMHGWGSMPQADMYGMRGSGHPGLSPGMAAMMQPGMQPGMPPAPQVRSSAPHARGSLCAPARDNARQHGRLGLGLHDVVLPQAS